MSHSSVTFHHQWSGRRTEHKRYTPAHSSTQTFERDTLQEHVSPGATLWLLDEGHVCFYAKCRVFFQEVMNRCIPENGGEKKKKWIDGAGSRSAACLLDLSRRWPRHTRKAETRPARCCSCLIGVISASKHSKETAKKDFLSIPQAPDQCSLCTFTVL